jgi:hypothetical protein
LLAFRPLGVTLLAFRPLFPGRGGLEAAGTRVT